MTEDIVSINTDAGVHARPAMMLVRSAMKYPCEIFLLKDDYIDDLLKIYNSKALCLLVYLLL